MSENRNYIVEISECSKELSVKEKIMLKDISNAVRIDEALNESDSFIISPVDYAVLKIHNEKSKNDKDYIKYVILDISGTKYVTGSNSFFNSFMDIYNEMKQEAPGEEFGLEIFKRDSKNYNGKYFISCSLV